MAGAEITRRNFRQYDKDNGQAGLYGPTARGWFDQVTLQVATRHQYHRVVPSRNMSIVALGFVTTNAATNDDQIDQGLFTAAWAKIISTGLTSGKANAAAGPQSVAITPTLLRAGVTYYYAFKYGTIGGTAATVNCASFGSQFGPRAFGLTAGLLEAGDTTGLAADALPATLTSGNAASTYVAGLLVEG